MRGDIAPARGGESSKRLPFDRSADLCPVHNFRSRFSRATAIYAITGMGRHSARAV